MEPDFWHARWRDNQIGFHEPEPNGLLREHLGSLGLRPGGRVFLPFCGKTRDIGYLAAQGFEVVGAELSETAVAALFEELGQGAEIRQVDGLRLYRAGRVTVFAGDMFGLDHKALGPVDAVYDRAALVALPQSMRAAYARHMLTLAPGAAQLLICFDYDPTEMEGPPFPVPEATVRALYGDACDIRCLERRPVIGPMAQRCAATETAWLLVPRAPGEGVANPGPDGGDGPDRAGA